MFSSTTTIPVSCKKAFKWLSRAESFRRLEPPWENMIRFQSCEPLKEGSRITFSYHLGPLVLPWRLKVSEYKQNESFTVEQIPFTQWSYHCRLKPLDDDSCEITEELDFQKRSFKHSTEKKITSALHYRQETMKNDLLCINRYPDKQLRILIAGSNGFIGSEIVTFLRAAGHKVIRLIRKKTHQHDVIFWNPNQNHLNTKDLEGFDAVINLCGENIADHPWTKRKKERILTSRLQSTNLLIEKLNQCTTKPPVLLNASAIGYYGNCQDQHIDEKQPQGKGFLADVCSRWEEAAMNFSNRTVLMRFGMVLNPKGGILKKTLPSFNIGLGAILGQGDHLISWISTDDLIYQLYHCLMQEHISGPVNFATPDIMSHKQFCNTLAKHLHRPCRLKVPAGLLRILFKDLADEVLLASIAAKPQKLLDSKAEFAYSDLEKTFAHLLK